MFEIYGRRQCVIIQKDLVFIENMVFAICCSGVDSAALCGTSLRLLFRCCFNIVPRTGAIARARHGIDDSSEISSAYVLTTTIPYFTSCLDVMCGKYIHQKSQYRGGKGYVNRHRNSKFRLPFLRYVDVMAVCMIFSPAWLQGKYAVEVDVV